MNEHGKRIETPAELAAVLTDFATVLELGQKTLLEPKTEQLDAVVSRKHALLHQINHVTPALMSRVGQQSGSDDDPQSIALVRQLIDRCQQHNRENGVLVAQGLKVCRSSIDFLRQNMHQNSVELYNPHGETRADLGSRIIGQA